MKPRINSLLSFTAVWLGAFALVIFVAFVGSVAHGQTWTTGPKSPIEAGTMLLLRDGRVLAHEGNSTSIAILTPDVTGSYVNGTWAMAAPLPAGYAPYNYSSAVLPDGRVIFEGGEYIYGALVYSTMGAIYDPKANTWTPVNPPAKWTMIGDAPSVLLASGTYMQANCCSLENQTAFLNAQTLTWTEGPNGLIKNHESGWTLLPDDTVMMVSNNTACGSDKSSQIYQPLANIWTCGPELTELMYRPPPFEPEIGSTALTYNGKVLQVGGNDIVATNILNVGTMTWSNGPIPLNGFNQDDGPAALEPNGKLLLLMWKPDLPNKVCQFFEFDPASISINALAYASNPPECPNGGAGVNSRLVPLPTGQILFTDFSITVELYSPAKGAMRSAAPTIYSTSLVLTSGSANNVLFGKQLNGLSQAVFFGDDYQGATNYPLVELVDAQGRVWFAPTHADSYSGIAPNAVSYTKFDVPAMPVGAYTMRVVTSGIASNDVQVTVRGQ